MATIIKNQDLVNKLWSESDNKIANLVTYIREHMQRTISPQELNTLNHSMINFARNLNKKLSRVKNRKKDFKTKYKLWLEEEFNLDSALGTELAALAEIDEPGIPGPQVLEVEQPDIQVDEPNVEVEQQELHGTPPRSELSIDLAITPPTGARTIRNETPVSRLRRKLFQSTPKYDRLSKATKRRRVADTAKLQESASTTLLLSAASRNCKAKGKLDLAKVLDLLTNDETLAARILENMEVTPQQTYTSEEALALITDGRLSRSQYEKLRAGALAHNSKLYPSYSAVYEGKTLCRPPKDVYQISDRNITVPLEFLLAHTVERLLLLQKDVLIQHFSARLNTELFCSWGFDGSSGHSNYKIKGENIEADSSLFATTLIPLRLICTDTQRIIWENPSPQSVRFCRPLSLKFCKETTQLICDERERVEQSISLLTPDIFDLEGFGEVVVRYNLALTLIDGKVLTALMGAKSASVCPYCKAGPASFNSLENLNSGMFAVEPHAFKHGMGQLHCRIRIMEQCLKVSYKLTVQKFAKRLTQAEKDIISYRKRDIQKKMRDAFGLRVDFVKQGAGTSNDGNTARTAFENYEKFADILELDVDLIKNLYFLLATISLRHKINADRFEVLCNKVFKQYVELYTWYPMSPTLHRLLVHGADIIRQHKLPIGMYGEEAGESRQKFLRRDREDHARKTSLRTTYWMFWIFLWTHLTPYYPQLVLI